MRTILVVALAATLSSCGFYRWHKADGATEGFDRDAAECQQSAAPGQWEGCMTGKGWINSGRW